MRTSAQALIPIFRSSLQARLLLRVLTDDEPPTITDLARLLDAPEPTAYREARRLMDADLVTGTRVGRSVVVRPADDNPATVPLRQLLVVTYGPVPFLERALSGVDSALGREVNITFVSPERWASGEETFLAALRERPLVQLGLGSRTGAAA